MEQNKFNFSNNILPDNNNILLGIIKDLNRVLNNSKDNLNNQILTDVIKKINNTINNNKKFSELIQNEISLLIQTFNKLKINKSNEEEIKFNDGSKYIGQVLNGLPHGRGIWYSTNGDRYEGDFKNGKKEGKGIYYYNREPFKGDRYEGDYKNNKQDGKGIIYFSNGDRYEGDLKNGKMEGEGVLYWSDGGRAMGDYYNDKPIGKHVILTKERDVKTIIHKNK